MTPKELRAKREAIGREIKKLNAKIEHLRLDRKHLELECAHPRGYTYSDYGGGSNYCCPDCGMDR